MSAESHAEHRWLARLAGEWTWQSEALAAPGGPPTMYHGTESVRAVGDVWVQCEGRGDMSVDGQPTTTLMTLGYDPARGRFVGTFLGSNMTHLWIYDGALDEEGRVLTLDTEGPSFADDGTTARYQDVIELHDDDHRVLTARIQDADGSWREFMTTHYRRSE